MRRTFVVLCSVGLLLAVLAPTAAASTPQPVQIDSTMDVVNGPPNTGTFTASGSDLICATGNVTDTRYVWGESQGRGGNPTGVQLVVDKTFDCGASGQVFMRLQIHGVYVDESFTWTILGGTGDYAGLHGQGQGWTDYGPFECCGLVINHYLGFLVG